MASKASPARSSNRLACSRALARETPSTLAALAGGVIDGHQAETLTRATACLSPEDRRLVDEQLVGRLAGLSTQQLRATVTALVDELDPQAHVRRAARAAEDAYVSMRPAPDVMCVVSAMLPAAQGVAVYAALKRHAELLRASGDPRSQGKIMADTLYAHVTGRDPGRLPDIDLSLVMTDASLMAGDTVAAHLDGYGPLPAQTARDLLTPRDREAATRRPGGPTPDGDVGRPCQDEPRCTKASCFRAHGVPEGRRQDHGSLTADGPLSDDGSLPADGPLSDDGSLPDADVTAARVFVRRLYADPLSGEVFARDSRRRFFSEAQRALVVSRDRSCRTPWCGAPIRHVDHRVRHRDGGSTDLSNGQGLCQRCNQARERPRQAAVPPTLYLRASAVLPRISPRVGQNGHGAQGPVSPAAGRVSPAAGPMSPAVGSVSAAAGQGRGGPEAGPAPPSP